MSLARVQRRRATTSADGDDGDAVLQVRGLVAAHGATPVVKAVDLEVGQGEIVTLLGPSGCGKTTTLRCVAGLHRVSGGTIALNGQRVADQRTHVRPERRSVNMVFQSYALWPHMTVFENVAYGLKAQHLPGQEITARAKEMLTLVGLEEYGPRSASSLSGGQQQRVVLARALVTRPRLLLLDEPLSNLDVELRVRMRKQIHSLHRSLGLAMLYVTHDRTEALALSDRIVVMRDGVVQQSGRPFELYARPVNRFVADALGPVNVLPAVVTEAGPNAKAALASLPGAPVLPIAAACGERAAAAGDKIDVLVRPERLTLQLGAAAAPGIRAEAEMIEFLGNHSEIMCRSGAERFTVNLSSLPPDLRPGDQVTARLADSAEPPAWQPRSAD